jgi:3-hydroxyisobutyrate dehydrogenase
MGFAMARNLARAGFAVRAWNRSRQKAEPLAEDGATVAGSAADASGGADVVLTILADTEAVLAAVEGDGGAFSGQLGSEAIWLQMSTIGEAGSERCSQTASAHGVGFVDAPVLGTKQPAEEGQLVILGSGRAELHSRVEEIFAVLGQRTMWVGEEAGMGSRLKVAVNSWLLAVVEAGAESLALAEGLGLDPRLILEAIEGGALDLPYLRMKAQAMLEREFPPSFRLALAAKDAALVEESADRHQLDLPVLRAIRRRLEEGVPEHGNKDMSATFLTSAPAAR